MTKLSSILFFMIVSVISFSQSNEVNNTVLTPLEREYFFLLNRNEYLEAEKKVFLEIIDSLKNKILEYNNQSSFSNIDLPVTTYSELVELGTNIKMLNVYRTPYSFYLTVSVPVMNNKMTVDPHLPDFYTENYEFYYRHINSANLCTNRKESSAMYIDD